MGLTEPPLVARPPRSRLRWRLFWGTFAVVVVSLGWFWPARRNYYFKRDEVRRQLDVPYQAGVTDAKRQLDLYLPRRGGAGFPIVVFVHGGYWSALDRRWMQPVLGAFGNVGVAFARQGVGAAIIGYRQYPSIQRGADSLDDIASAIRFVRDSCAGWGCGALFVVGHSAGGHLVSLLAMDDRILARHGVDANTIAGFVSIDGIFDVEAALPTFSSEQAAVMRQLFGPDAATLASYATISYARPHHPRFAVHGQHGRRRSVPRLFSAPETAHDSAREPRTIPRAARAGPQRNDHSHRHGR